MKRVAGRSACGAVVATASAVEARAAAQAATTQASAPLPLRRDTDDTGFPVAGAVLLLVLTAATALAWWRNRRAGAPFPRLGVPAGALRVTASSRLDVHTRLHVVEWQGRQLLLAVNGAAAPVVLDRIGPVPAEGDA